MAFVVTFEDYTPTPRYDNKPWTLALIYEGPAETGPWTLLETIALSPTDTDPSNPATRNFTTELAQLENGWYQLVWKDATGDQRPTEPVHNVVEDNANYLPTIRDVAALLRARTKDNQGNEVGTFNANTRPTAGEVNLLITMAAREVRGHCGPTFPEVSWESAAATIALRTAMAIELGYWPEQINSRRSPYQGLADLYHGVGGKMGMLAALCNEVTIAEEEDGSDLRGLPAFYFGDSYYYPTPSHAVATVTATVPVWARIPGTLFPDGYDRIAPYGFPWPDGNLPQF